MLRVGLTGGMGAGKSTVAEALRECGAVVIDSDVIARAVVEPGTPGLAAVVDAFGADVLAPDGSLDRPALAAKAFGDDESRKRLNSIVHPLVGKRQAEEIAAAPADAVVVQDIPLLVENHLGALFQLVIVVFVDAEERVRRLVAHRGIAEADARARISAQATDEQRHAAADIALDNSGPPGSLDAVVQRIWNEWLVPFERNIRSGTVAIGEDPDDAAVQRLIARLQVVCGNVASRIERADADIRIHVADLAAADALAEPLRLGGFPRIEAGRHGSADPAQPVTVRIIPAT